MTMNAPSVSAWLVFAYALSLVTAAWCLDATARRVSSRAAQWRVGQFRYHPEHDAWVCPEDHWLWPTSFDPQHRVTRYRAQPSVCNSCPVKETCTTSEHGREVSREVDPWPHSEAGRFHRGIACCVAALGAVLPVVMLARLHSVADILVLLGAAAIVVVGTLPLVRHLWNSPSNAPGHLQSRTGTQEHTAVTQDRYRTRWSTRRTEQDRTP